MRKARIQQTHARELRPGIEVPLTAGINGPFHTDDEDVGEYLTSEMLFHVREIIRLHDTLDVLPQQVLDMPAEHAGEYIPQIIREKKD